MTTGKRASGRRETISKPAEATQFFYELTPDRILDAVEEAGLRCTGRVLQLNSMENRVYDIELEPGSSIGEGQYSDRCIAKFYRPGRWSAEQIKEEHQFLRDLSADLIPVAAPIDLDNGSTVREAGSTGILFALFPKVGGRSPDELTLENAEQVGRLIARMHLCGARREAKHRIAISPQSYGLDNLRYLSGAGVVPAELMPQLTGLVERICEIAAGYLAGVPIQRIHGDCHLANILSGRDGLFLVDFDDMLRGPCVQDLWLVVPSRDAAGKAVLQRLLSGYEQMREFRYETLSLIEPLRALRLVHYATWIAKRWSDPIFPRTFPHFASPLYWKELVSDLQEIFGVIQQGGFLAVAENQ